jgi:hypothetical protein
VTFTWQAFVDLAVWLLDERMDEASQRTVISRAYYAAYHAASAHIRTNKLCPPEQRLTHDRVWRLIRATQCQHCTELANLGFALRDARVRADYGNPYPGDLADDAWDSISTSGNIISLLREALPASET